MGVAERGGRNKMKYITSRLIGFCNFLAVAIAAQSAVPEPTLVHTLDVEYPGAVGFWSERYYPVALNYQGVPGPSPVSPDNLYRRFRAINNWPTYDFGGSRDDFFSINDATNVFHLNHNSGARLMVQKEEYSRTFNPHFSMPSEGYVYVKQPYLVRANHPAIFAPDGTVVWFNHRGNAGCGSHLFALDPDSGELKWEYVGFTAPGEPAIDEAGNLFFTTGDGDQCMGIGNVSDFVFVSFDTKTGELRWKVPVTHGGTTRIDRFGRLYVNVDNKTINVYSPAGKQIDSHNIDTSLGNRVTDFLLGNRDMLYAVSGGNSTPGVVAYNLVGRTNVWEWAAEDEVPGSDVITRPLCMNTNGWLYVLRDEDQAFVFETPSTAPEPSSWPQYMGNSQNTGAAYPTYFKPLRNDGGLTAAITGQTVELTPILTRGFFLDDGFVIAPVGGTNSFSYQWRKDGIDVVGATSSILTIPSFDAGDIGIYTLSVSSGPHSYDGRAYVLAETSPDPIAGDDRLTIESGAIVKFATEIGKRYQIEVSSDMENWFPFQDVVHGDGKLHVTSLPTMPKRMFLRHVRY